MEVVKNLTIDLENDSDSIIAIEWDIPGKYYGIMGLIGELQGSKGKYYNIINLGNNYTKSEGVVSPLIKPNTS